jgi:hypothetical protein
LEKYDDEAHQTLGESMAPFSFREFQEEIHAAHLHLPLAE